jgi:hypothetical protein
MVPPSVYLSVRLSPGQAIVQGVRLLRWQSARDLTHDRNDLLHDTTAGAAAGSVSQQIAHRGANLLASSAGEIPIVLI